MSFRVAFLINTCSYKLCQLNQINSEAVLSGELTAALHQLVLAAFSINCPQLYRQH